MHAVFFLFHFNVRITGNRGLAWQELTRRSPIYAVFFRKKAPIIKKALFIVVNPKSIFLQP